MKLKIEKLKVQLEEARRSLNLLRHEAQHVYEDAAAVKSTRPDLVAMASLRFKQAAALEDAASSLLDAIEKLNEVNACQS